MDCKQLVDYLSDYIDHNLSEELTAEAQEHLRTCPNCHVVLSSTEQMIRLYKEHQEQQEIPAERQQHLYAQLADIFLKRDSQSD